MDEHIVTTSDSERTAEHWSQLPGDAFSASIYWLANPTVQARYHRKAVGGRDYPHWVNFCVEHHMGAARPVGSILDIGCGDGELDRHLVALGAARQIFGLDLSPVRVESARRAARQAGLEQLFYRVADVEQEQLTPDSYDAVFFNSSLHHIERLEHVLETVRKSLTAGGLLFLNEYIGPNRFALGPREREALHACYALIPARYRRSLRDTDRGRLLASPPIPDPHEVARVDPSESIRSEDIITVLPHFFDLIEINRCGGTLLHFLLDGIAGHFTPSDPASLEILEMLFSIEDRLIGSGDLQDHFALIVARPHRS